MDKNFNLKKGVILAILAAISLSIMIFLTKIVVPDTNTNMILFSRFSLGLVYISLWIFIKRIKYKVIHLRIKHVKLHFIRAVLSLLAMFFLYYSIRFISLVEANVLVMTNTLFILLIGVLFLHHHVTYKHWIAVLTGFLGVILIINPGYLSFEPKALYALIAGLLSGITFIFIRKLSIKDHPNTSLFYYMFFAAILSGFLLIFNWKTPDLKTLYLLMAIGLTGTFYQDFLIRASVYAPAKITSTLLYISIIFSFIFDRFYFKDIPNIISWLGIVLVLAGNIFIIQFSRKPRR